MPEMARFRGACASASPLNVRNALSGAPRVFLIVGMPVKNRRERSPACCVLLERSRQAMSGPSGVTVRCRPM